MGKRGAAGPPGLGMTGFSYNLPLPGGNGASTKRGLTWRGASQVPIQLREPKQSAQWGTEGRGGILLQNGEIWEVFAGAENAKRRIGTELSTGSGGTARLRHRFTQVGEGI